MIGENGIIVDLFPPLAWDEDGIRTALEIQEAADGDEAWEFTEDELTFLAKSIAYYMGKPREEWIGVFEVDTEIDIEDPTKDGRFVIDMVYPKHIEPPASLR